MSSYVTKAELKNITQTDVSSFATKQNLSASKSEADKFDIDKLVPVPNDLAKLSNVVKNGVVKKIEYNKLVGKVDNIDTTNFASKTKYEKDGSDFKDKVSKIHKKIPDVCGLVKKHFNIKVTEIELKLPSTSG